MFLKIVYQKDANMIKRGLLSFAGAALLSALLFACSDSGTSAKDSFDVGVVCPADGVNAYGEPNRGTFTDERDGQVYKYTTIGKQVWMAENLKFETSYRYGCASPSLCTYALKENSTRTGKLDQNRLDTLCPAGWHIPSVDEWLLLVDNMGGAKHLKRLSPDFGTDDCKFNSIGRRVDAYSASYWTSTQYDEFWSYLAIIHNIESQPYVVYKENDQYMLVRCLKD